MQPENIVPMKNPLLYSQNQNELSNHNNAIQIYPSKQDLPKGSCKECLYTGVGTCTGLSLYFMYLASEVHVPTSEGVKEVMKQAARQKQFLLGGSAVWTAAGVYRLYLG